MSVISHIEISTPVHTAKSAFKRAATSKLAASAALENGLYTFKYQVSTSCNNELNIATADTWLRPLAYLDRLISNKRIELQQVFDKSSKRVNPFRESDQLIVHFKVA